VIICAVVTALSTAGKDSGSCSAALQVITYLEYSMADIFIVSVMQNRCLLDYDSRLLFAPLSILLAWDTGALLTFSVACHVDRVLG
jgi:hypothetical protein